MTGNSSLKHLKKIRTMNSTEFTSCVSFCPWYLQHCVEISVFPRRTLFTDEKGRLFLNVETATFKFTKNRFGDICVEHLHGIKTFATQDIIRLLDLKMMFQHHTNNYNNILRHWFDIEIYILMQDFYSLVDAAHRIQRNVKTMWIMV